MKKLCFLDDGKANRTLATLGFLLLGSLAFIGSGALGGFSSTIAQPGGNNGFGGGSLVNEVIANGNTCYSTGSGSGGTVSTDTNTCTTPFFSNDTIPTTNTVTQENLGVVASSAGALTAGASCGAQGLIDSSTLGTNPSLIYDGVTLGQAGDSSVLGQGSALFNGTTGYAATATSLTYTSPATFTIAGWFKTAATVADTGVIMSFSDEQDEPSATPGANSYDKEVYIRKSNKELYFMVNDGGTVDLYNWNEALVSATWYFMVISDSSAGVSISIDDGTARTKAAYKDTDDLTGYWTLGYGYDATAFVDPAYSNYFNGNLSDVAIYPSLLTAAQETALYGGGTISQVTYASDTVADGATSFWPMNDTGGYLYPDAIAGAGAGTTTFSDASGNGNIGTPEGGVTAGEVGEFSDGNGANFNGSTGYVQTTSAVNPQTLSEGAWFETTTSGGIMGMTTVQGDGTPSMYDRMLWIDQAGHIVYGVYPGANKEITSPLVYDTGQWYYVMATVGPSGMDLYVDGSLVASNPLVTGPQSYSGYWHLGFAYATGWADAPTSNYFTGDIEDAAVFNSQLSANSVAALAAAGSQSSEFTQIMVATPAGYWTLGQDGSGICNYAEITIQEVAGAATTCIYPSGNGACPAIGNSYTLATLTGDSLSTQVLGASTTGSMTLTFALNGALPTAALGVHLTLPLYVELEQGLWYAQIYYPYENVLEL